MKPAFIKPNIVVITDAPEIGGLFLKGPPDYLVSIAEAKAEEIAFDANASLIVIDHRCVVKLEANWFRDLQCCHPAVPVLVIVGTTEVPSPKFAGLAVGHLERHNLENELWPAVAAALRKGHSSSSSSEDRPPLSGYLYTGKCARQIEPLVAAVAQADIPVLIQGETGVGKEVLARHIHAASARASRPFLSLNCAALPAELVESELFGYERGAFTGAFRSTPGKFELADGGVLLLDEIGDMDVRLQAKLLQVLQNHEFHRLGATRTSRVNVRVIAATHCDLETAIVEKRFREDLYYRLNVASVVIPPLRERLDELIPLAEYFLKRHASPANANSPEITPTLSAALLEYDWPGNVRELENLMRKYIVMPDPELLLEDIQRRSARRMKVFAASAAAADGHAYGIEASDTNNHSRQLHAVKPSLSRLNASSERTLSEQVSTERTSPDRTMAQVDAYKRATEADAIRAALERTNWNRKRAASLLQVDYKVFLYRMKRLGIGIQLKEAPITSVLSRDQSRESHLSEPVIIPNREPQRATSSSSTSRKSTSKVTERAIS